MKVLALWSEPESPNLGVRALSAGTAALLGDVFGDVDLSYQGFGPGDSPTRIGNWKTQLKRALIAPNDLTRWIKTFDLVIDTRAGDSFSDIYGQLRIVLMTLMGEIVRRSGVPLVLGPQTIGPFNSMRGKLMAKRSLSSAKSIMVRDTRSALYSAKLGYQPNVVTTDVVFALPVPNVPVSRDIVLNPSGLLWNANQHVDPTAYRQILRSLCGGLISRGRRVSLLAHVLDSTYPDNDVPLVTLLASEFPEVEVLVPADLDDVRTMLGSASVVIGSRMHACLNALSIGRPAVPLAYSRKFHPLLDDLGWPHTVDLRDGGNHTERVLRLLDRPGLDGEAKFVSSHAHDLLERAHAGLRAAL